MSPLNQIHSGRRHRAPRLLIYGTEGIGKAQPLDAKVLTPRGFVAMGNIDVGDSVIGSDGKPHRVLGVYPQGTKEVFRVVFRDGSTTECCDDHLWFTQTKGERAQGLSGAVRSLRDIRRTLRYGTHFNHGVPRVCPVEFAGTDTCLPIDPWLLGMYLGDGSSSGNVVITNPEPDIQKRIAASLDDRDTCSSDGGIGLRVRSKQRTNRPSTMKTALQELELANLEAQHKRVPDIYLHSSAGQRLELLRGLLDSDGYVTNPGATEFCTASSRLAQDVCFLIRSLGGSAKQTTKKATFTYNGEKRRGMLAHRIFASFPDAIIPVSSEKHLAKWATPQWAIRHTIRSVESVGQKACQCIRIDALDSLYVTDDFILTHNSTLAAQAPKPVFLPTEDGLDQIECDSFPLAQSFEDVLGCLSVLATEEHNHNTVVIDSADWLERLIFDNVCKQYGAKSIEKVDGGFGKGYVHALSQWRQVIDALRYLREQKGMIVILLAHAKIEKFADPESTTFDRFSPRLNKNAAALLCEWCDAILLATREHGAAKGEKSGGQRILRCVGTPACVAKNRYGLPETLPLSWPDLMSGLAGNLENQRTP
ncbi:MAG: AAA family ATPase [Planctomycetes bacterium]|nr:AAA family ATPase [Planctomycetota bacterium]